MYIRTYTRMYILSTLEFPTHNLNFHQQFINLSKYDESRHDNSEAFHTFEQFILF